MKEKIEQLCDQIKDLLKKNDREYIIGVTLAEMYSSPSFAFPEYYKDIIDNFIKFGEEMDSSYDSLGIDWDDFTIEHYEEPVYDYDDDEEYLLYEELHQFNLIAIRVEADKLFFCVQEILTDDEQTACDYLEEVNTLVQDYDDENIVRALEAYVRILSDETKNSIFWKI
jgi:hypothetical protein